MPKLNVALIIVAILIATLAALLGPEIVRSLHSGFSSVVGPFLKTGRAVQEQIGAVGSGLKTLEQLEEEHRELTLENRELRATVQILRDLEEENNRLRNALQYMQRSVFNLVPAQVVSRDASTWWNTMRINRGFEDGIEPDMPVITDEGLVGKTVSVSKNIATVLLISDENCRVGARITGTNEKGILQGRRVSPEPGGELELNFLTRDAEIEPGTQVYTMGVDRGVFPPGVLIGKVESFGERELDGQALVEPAVDLTSVQDVFVIVPQ